MFWASFSMRFGWHFCFLGIGIRRTQNNLYCQYSSMKATLKLDWSMKGHFNTSTEVGSRVNECNSDFLHWRTASLFSDYLFIYLALFYRTKGRLVVQTCQRRNQIKFTVTVCGWNENGFCLTSPCNELLNFDRNVKGIHRDAVLKYWIRFACQLRYFLTFPLYMN